MLTPTTTLLNTIYRQTTESTGTLLNASPTVIITTNGRHLAQLVGSYPKPDQFSVFTRRHQNKKK